MINHETVAFIGMLNELAWRSQDDVFIPVRDKKAKDGIILCNAICTKLFYDVDVAKQIDDKFVYFQLIKIFNKDGYTYYPHTFVAIPKNSQEDDKCVVVFAEEDWNIEQEFIVCNGHWYYAKDI